MPVSRQIADAIAERDQAITDLRSLGWSSERIGRLLGITRQRVEQILKERKYVSSK